MINSAKAILLADSVNTNTQAKIISDFQEQYVATGKVELGVSFEDLVYQIRAYAPTKEFATNYISNALQFLNELKTYREKTKDS